MNALTFFIARFSAPLVGFALLPLLDVPAGVRLADLASLLVAAVLVVSVLLVARAEKNADRIGRRLGRTVRIVRSTTDPDAWARALRTFQQNLAEGFSHRFPRALALTYGVLSTDLTILVLSMRLMGLDAHAAPTTDIAAAYAFAFPLTVFPAQGLGGMDTAILSSLSETAGAHVVEPALAAMLVWRTLTVAGPFLLGGIALMPWRRDRTARGDVHPV